jgi:hypothetical protein
MVLKRNDNKYYEKKYSIPNASQIPKKQKYSLLNAHVHESITSFRHTL